MTHVISDELDLFLAHIGRADEVEALTLVRNLLGSGVPGERVLTDLVIPALRTVGERWANGDWSVAREHGASHITGRVVHLIADATPRPRSAARVVVCCAQGDWHGLASTILAALLRVRGIEAMVLPPGTGAGELARVLPDAGADSVAIGCMVSTALPGARAMVEVARRVGVPVLVGGPGFGPDGRWAGLVGANGWAQDARQAADMLASPDWPTITTPAPRLRHLPDAAHDSVGLLRTPLVAAGMAALVPIEGQRSDSTMRDGLVSAVDALAVSLFLDDHVLFVDFTRWFADVLEHRDVKREALAAAYRAFAAQLAHMPRAGSTLTAAGAVL
ncbi:B12-binding domain-containing protein [Embleya sp. NPDC050493]|uniref:B12-binding domain-containing protein n=1 Tax=Embleya sp. NPDC050493 TaxID=3363989 RepID=UPI0037B1EFCE